MVENGENNKGFFSSLLSDGIKVAWKKAPTSVKLYIIGGIAGFILLIIIIAAIVGAVSSIFLDYSNDAQGTNNIQAEYEEYWMELCEDGDANCTEEQIEAAKELKKSQEKFYKQLDKLVKKYGVSKEQKYLVLTTVFYDYDIEDFTEGNGAFTIVEDDDEIDYEVEKDDAGENIYKKEKDSLKELIKQFKVYSATCKYTYKGSNNEDIDGSYTLKKQDDTMYILGFFDYAKYKLGFNVGDGFEEAVSNCINDHTNATVSMSSTTDGDASLESFYKYLRTTTYFDEKPHLSSYFSDYGKNHGLDIYNFTSWPNEDLEIVRNEIIENIKMIVEEYMDENDNEFITVGSGTSYWWPIGSLETTDEDGILFASGDPETTIVNSEWGWRTHPISGVEHLHDGIDLHGIANSTNIIASMGGTVISIVNECASFDSNGCGGGYGNHVVIQDTKGNTNLYAHMYLDTITVAVGDTVSQGQVLGKVGSSGNSTGPHLHFTIRINGISVNPRDYISAENPRPASLASIPFNEATFTKEEFVAKLKSYFSQDEVCNSSSSQYVNGCNSFKDEVLNNNGAETIYEVATDKNINPVLVSARSALEGYSPGTSYNYFGYGCTNTGGIQACYKFSSFKSAMENFFNNAAQYSSLEDMMSRYAYLGDYWYTGTNWGWGGCAYASYIYPDGVPTRVQNACSKPDGTCTIAHEAACVPTTEEDRYAYTVWQVQKMASAAESIFG